MRDLEFITFSHQVGNMATLRFQALRPDTVTRVVVVDGHYAEIHALVAGRHQTYKVPRGTVTVVCACLEQAGLGLTHFSSYSIAGGRDMEAYLAVRAIQGYSEFPSNLLELSMADGGGCFIRRDEISRILGTSPR